MRGRRPHPTVVKLFRNNPGRRPLNPNEPQHPPVDAAPPVDLDADPIAREEWTRLIVDLNRGHVTRVDRSTLAAYCLKYSQWRRLEAAVAAEPFLVTTINGHKQPNPLVGMAHRTCQLMLRLSVELGITPSARTRIIAAPFEEPKGQTGDAFTDFQRQRRRP